MPASLRCDSVHLIGFFLAIRRPSAPMSVQFEKINIVLLFVYPSGIRYRQLVLMEYGNRQHVNNFIN